MIKESQLQKRAKIINYLYKFELMGLPIDSLEAFTSGDFSSREVKIIENIQNHYKSYKNLIEKFIKSTWNWNRIAPLERSILLYGAFELIINDKALVINELVILTKGYSPGSSYKFINATLDKMGEYYDETKRSKKRAH